MDSDQIINLLDSKFNTKVMCSCAVEDYYSAENLISNDKQKLDRGFMAFRVIKPPVELEFELCCCIELVSIKIWPRVNSLKSIGFEIFVNSDKSRDYYKTASHFNLQENGIQFVNSSINSNHFINSIYDENFAVVPFFPSSKNQLRKVKNIKCVIKQTARCVPVIKRIEIWGKISKFVSNEQKQSIIEIIRRDIERTVCVEKEEESHKNDDQSNFALNDDIDENSVIPEPFLDLITFEIMALPMVLPCGKNIDNSTLLKHIEQEEKWGRVASDPFTGQPFTDSRKPVLNTHLKAQIDSFLLKNCSVRSVSILPRTVGSITKRRIEQNEEHGDNRKLTKTDDILKKSNTLFSNPDKSSLLPHSIQNGNPSSISTASTSTSASSASSSSSSSSIEIKSQTLDEAIRGILKIGKYTTNTSTESDLNCRKCFQCLDIVSNNLYTITVCSHLICRNCLVTKNISICKCGETFTNIDVIKYHHKIIL